MVLVLAILIAFGGVPAGSLIGGGKAFAEDAVQDGSAEHPYLIRNADELNAIRNHLNEENVYFELADNIDLTPSADEKADPDYEGWVPIGGIDENGNWSAFDGHLDGKGKIIKGLTVNRNTDYAGLFGAIGEKSSITDIKLEAVDITGFNNVGSLVGFNDGGTISRVYAAGKVSGSAESGIANSIGGLVGENYGEISDSYATGSVNGISNAGGLVGYNNGEISGSNSSADVSASENSYYIGGLVGFNDSGTISDVYAAGNVSAKEHSYHVGGLVGYNDGGTISDVYAAGSVSASEDSYHVGGLIGYNDTGTISGSYSSGNVNGTSYVGGLVGSNDTGTISDSYSSGIVIGTAYVGGLVGYNNGDIGRSYAIGGVNDGVADDTVGGLVGTNDGDISSNSYYDRGTTGQEDEGKGEGKSSDAMKDISTYFNEGNVDDENWDFASIWAIDSSHNGGYPYLRAIQAYLSYDGNESDDDTKAPMDHTSYMPGAAAIVKGPSDLVKTGYSFAGWSTQRIGQASLAAGDSLTLTDSTTLYAQWKINSYTVSFNVDGGSFVADQIVNYKGKATKPETDPTKSGYEFAGWYENSSLTVAFNFDTTAITANRTVYAKWTANAPLNGGGYTLPSDNKVTSTNGKLTLPAGKAGEVSLDNGLVITIPANASTKELKLTIDKIADTRKLLTSKDILISAVYEILKNFPENFDIPITLTFTFDPASLKSGQTASVFYYDETKKEWVEVAGGKVNGNHIAVAVNHFTKYAVLATPAEEPTTTPKPTISFSDITGHWAEASINQAVSSGIASGYPDGTFKPDRKVTRAEFALMLMNVLKTQEAGAALTFTDAAKIGSWAQKAVAQAVQAVIIKGYADGSFRPDSEITRAEMAAMLANASGQSIAANAATGFADDNDIPAWAKGSVAFVKQAGIVQGKSNNRFSPQDHATRAEAVTVLLNMLAQKNK